MRIVLTFRNATARADFYAVFNARDAWAVEPECAGLVTEFSGDQAETAADVCNEVVGVRTETFAE